MTKLMTPKRVILAALVLLMLWGSAMVYLSYQRRLANEPFLAEFLLPDGVHKLRLLRIEEGLIEYHWKAPPGNRLLTSILGNRDRLWDIHLKNSGHVPFNDWKPTSFLFRIVDEHGRWANPSDFPVAHFEFEDAHGYRFYDSGFPGDNYGGGAFLLHRTAFPRREKTMRLNLQFFGARPPVNDKWYTMEVPNPFYRTDFPDWKAEPLPVVHTAHGVTTRLLDHGYGLRFFQPTLQRQVGSDQWNGCQLLFLRVEDATGNLMGDFHHAPLSPFEPVWKVTADIVPPADFLIPPHELQTLGTFTVPAVGNIELIGKSVMVADAKVTLIGICGGGTARKDAAGRWKGSPAVTPYGAHEEDPRSVTLSIGNRPDPFLMIETSKDTSKSDREKGIYVRCRTTQLPIASTIRSFQRGRPVAIEISDHNHPVSEVTVDLAELKPLRFEYLVEPPDKFREEVLHPPKEK